MHTHVGACGVGSLGGSWFGDGVDQTDLSQSPYVTGADAGTSLGG